jgi:TonB family protein
MILRVLAPAAAFCALAAPVSSALAADKPGREPLTLRPATEWNVDYAADKCRLARGFGTGDEQVIFFLERYEPGDSFFLLVSGKPLARFNDERAKLAFGPAGHETDRPLLDGKLGDQAAFMTSGMTLADIPGSDETHKSSRTRSSYNRFSNSLADTDVLLQVLKPDQEAAIDWFEVRQGGMRPVRLSLGPMGKPMAAMRTCIDELIGHWGIDVAAHRTLTRAVTPSTNPANWIGYRDYPVNLLAKGAQGLVQFRLLVGVDGKPTDCFIQESTRPKGFDDAVCKAMMTRARFDPALDKDGKPIKSYWRTAVRFQMP